MSNGECQHAHHIPCTERGILGELIYFFEKACGNLGYLLDVNHPSTNPAWKAYKRKTMFALLRGESPATRLKPPQIKAPSLIPASS